MSSELGAEENLGLNTEAAQNKHAKPRISKINYQCSWIFWVGTHNVLLCSQRHKSSVTSIFPPNRPSHFFIKAERTSSFSDF